jgi:hypothetical protein
MKNFLKENWFKLMTGTSMLVFSFAFLMYAVSPSFANSSKETPAKSDYALVPLNKDGSINIKISEEQMSEMTATQDINIAQISGSTASYTKFDNGTRALDVVPCTYRGSAVHH